MKEFTLNQGELNLMVILERIKNGELTQAEAANLLKLCVRQVRRKAKRYVTEGVAGLIHRGAGRPGNRTFSQEKTTAILRLVSEKYMVLKNKAGPTFIAEQLEKNDGIIINHETLRKLMIRHNLWSVADRKKRRHQWRERKHHFGELVQIDGSFHRWFGDEYATLIAFIDDATGKLMVAEFVKQETIKDFACLTHQYLKKYGRPLVLYSDRGKVFKVNKSNGSTASKTQFQRILQELDIDLVHAYSPQAKGRVERLFKTMQDRLVKELELANISTCSAANRYLNNVYIQEHNKKFAVKPIENADFHRSIKGINMLSIFCLKFERIINNN